METIRKEEQEPMGSPGNALADQGIEILCLSKRSYNCLKRAGIHTIAQLTSLTPSQVSAIRGLGRWSLADIQARLAKHSLSLAKEPSPHPDVYPTHVSLLEQLGVTYPHPDVYSTTQGPSVLDDDNASICHPIGELSLSVRAHNALKRVGVLTIEALLAMSLDEVAAIRNVGSKTLAEIREKLRVYLSANPALATKVQKASKRGKLKSRTSLAELGIPSWLRKELLAGGIRFVEEIVACSEEELLLRSGLGYRDILVLKQALSARGLKLVAKTVIRPLVDMDTLTALHERGVPLGKISIARLALPKRWEETLMGKRFGNIQELATASEVVLRAACFPTYPDRVLEIKSRLNRYLSWLLEQTSWQSEVLGQGISPLYLMELLETTLAEIINRFLSDLYERERMVVEMRYGLDGQGACTLEEVGEVLGVTRERVRQLQKRALKHLSHSKRRQHIRAITALIEDALEQAGGVLNENQLCERCNAVLNSGGVDTLGATQLILDCDDRFQQVKRTRIWGLARYPLDSVPLICAKLKGLLKADHAPLPISVLLQRFENTRFCQEQGTKWPTEFVEACLRADPNIEISNDGLCALVSWGSTRLDEIVLAMRQMGHPAHFTEIARAANELLPPDKQLSPQYAYNILLSNDLFVRVGRGIFGLAEWGLPSDRCLADAAYRVLSEANRPLHIDVLTDKVLETWQARRMSVLVAVENDDRFCKVGHRIYWLRERTARRVSGEEA
ncbi:MAG TPA: hypothetical protein EYP49_02055, partial [Anaerolineae bacterium]|nr:hypothetical protein [Anaerolineae bacterium]